MSDAYLTLDSEGLDDDSLERVHFADITHEGGWSVVKLGLELRQSGRGELCGKLGPGCNVVALLSEEVVGVGSDFVVLLSSHTTSMSNSLVGRSVKIRRRAIRRYRPI